jgi:hypothetical protein
MVLACFAVLRGSSDDTRAHWHFPYFMTAAFKISSSVFFLLVKHEQQLWQVEEQTPAGQSSRVNSLPDRDTQNLD